MDSLNEMPPTSSYTPDQHDEQPSSSDCEQPAYYPQPNSRLLTLPGELLNHVIDFLLATDSSAEVSFVPGIWDWTKVHCDPFRMTAPGPQPYVRRIPHPITQTCQQLRATHLASFAEQAANEIGNLTTSTTTFDFSAVKDWLECSVAEAQQFHLKVKITPSWMEDSNRSISALSQVMISPRARHVVYEFDLSSINDPWTVVGCVRKLDDETRMRYKADPMAWNNLHAALRASSVREMMAMNANDALGRLATKRSESLKGTARNVIAAERAWLEKRVRLAEMRE